MSLNGAEGISYDDYTSTLAAYDTSTGSKIRDITAASDIRGSGYDKSNPNVPIDFTAYAKQVHGN
jgi:hypothetical protein